MEFPLEKIEKIFERLNKYHHINEDEKLTLITYFGEENVNLYINLISEKIKNFKFFHKKSKLEFNILNLEKRENIFVKKGLSGLFYCSECNLIQKIQPICCHAMYAIYGGELDISEFEEIDQFLHAMNTAYFGLRKLRGKQSVCEMSELGESKSRF